MNMQISIEHWIEYVRMLPKLCVSTSFIMTGISEISTAPDILGYNNKTGEGRKGESASFVENFCII